MGIVDDCLDRFQSLASERSFWEAHWLDVAKYALPDIDRFDTSFGNPQGRSAAINAMSEPTGARKAVEIYDQTSLWAVDRGTAGFLSLVTPQSEKWHGVRLADPFAPEPSDDEERWLDRLRDYLHTMRANPQTGFWVAHKAAIRGVWGLGTSVIYIEEAIKRGAPAPISYRYIPLGECYLATGFEGMVDTNYRLFNLSARQAVQKFGEDRVSGKTKEKAADPKRRDDLVEILHAVEPRSDAPDDGTTKGARWRSVYIERADKHLIGESGYFEFPYVVHHWNRTTQSPYSEGPLALALAEIKSLNMLSKTALKAAQLGVSPAYATIDDGINRVNFNSNAINPGLLSKEGKLLVQPINGGQRADFAETILNLKREQIKETLYVNVWQILISNPQMTATEAMIRANEKGDLLGPAGNSIQVGLSHQIDRELDILKRLGAFDQGAPLSPPQSLQGRPIGVRFSSPLDRMQMATELTGAKHVIEIAGMLAQVGKMDAIERLDSDEILDLAQEVMGAPRKIFRSQQAVDQERAQTAQMQKMQAMASMAAQAGQAGQEAAQGAEMVANAPSIQNAMAAATGAA